MFIYDMAYDMSETSDEEVDYRSFASIANPPQRSHPLVAKDRAGGEGGEEGAGRYCLEAFFPFLHLNTFQLRPFFAKS